MTTVTELRDLGDAELLERLEADKEELFNLRFQLATGQLDNPMRIKQVRHEVARILTIVRERELEAERGLPEAGPATARGSERRAGAASSALAPASDATGSEATPGEDEASASGAATPEGARAKRGLLRKKKEQE